MELDTSQKLSTELSLLHRRNRICSLVLALALICDPFYNSLRLMLDTSYIYDLELLELGHGDLNLPCHHALNLLSSDEDHGKKLLDYYLKLAIIE